MNTCNPFRPAWSERRFATKPRGKQEAGTCHVPRSRKRRNQKKCAVTRSGTDIYLAHTINEGNAATSWHQGPPSGTSRAATAVRQVQHTRAGSCFKWPTSVQRLTTSIVPEGLEFADIGDGDPCRCVGDCFMDFCNNALLSIYCTPDVCHLGGVCSNSPRSFPGLKLYDTCRVGLGVHTTAYIEVGDVVGEFVGRLFEYPAVIEDQPAQAVNQNSGYTMLLNVQSVSGMYVYIEALKCGSITKFMSHSCDPNVKFVEMQNGTNVKVLARMIKTARSGTQLTVNYGDKIWFKCACDSCWVDPDDGEN